MPENVNFSCAVFGIAISSPMENRVADVVESRALALLSLGCAWHNVEPMLAADAAGILGVPSERVRIDLDADQVAQADGFDSWLLAVVVVPVLA